jgi:hypothetical protein
MTAINWSARLFLQAARQVGQHSPAITRHSAAYAAFCELAMLFALVARLQQWRVLLNWVWVIAAPESALR